MFLGTLSNGLDITGINQKIVYDMSFLDVKITISTSLDNIWRKNLLYSRIMPERNFQLNMGEVGSSVTVHATTTIFLITPVEP